MAEDKTHDGGANVRGDDARDGTIEGTQNDATDRALNAARENICDGGASAGGDNAQDGTIEGTWDNAMDNALDVARQHL